MAAKLSDIEERLTALEREIADLKSVNTIRAPLRVINSEGKPILQVDATQNGGQLTLLDNDGGEVASITASRYGGNVTLYACPTHIEDVGDFGNQYIELGASTTGASFIIREAKNGGMELYLSSNALSFYNARGEAVASIAVNPDDDGGIIMLTDQEGQPVFVQTSEDAPPAD